LDIAPQRMVDLCGGIGADVLNVHWPSPVGNGAAGENGVQAKAWANARRATFTRASAGQGPLVVMWQDAFQRSDQEKSPCALRDGGNLQIMPDGSAFTCGLLVDQPGASRYVWAGRGPRQRLESHELDLGSSDEPCPARLAETGSASTPVCIYSRSVHEVSSIRDDTARPACTELDGRCCSGAS
jgi:hypothetical protein